MGRKPRSAPPEATPSATPRPRRRAPGRPSGGVGDQRDALLDAAKHAFARFGFQAASLRAIASDAHVTPALAAYYFSDKTGLLEAVIDQRVAPLVQALLSTVASVGDDPPTQLRAFVRSYTATAALNPWLPQLIVREVLNEQGVLRDAFAQRFAFGMTSRLREVVQRAQQRGQLRPGLDPAAVVMSLISLCIFPFIATPLVSGALGLQVDEANAERLSDHHWALFWQGVEEGA